MSSIHIQPQGSTRESLALGVGDTVTFAGVVAEDGPSPAEIAVYATKVGPNQERIRIRGQAGSAFRITSDAAGTGSIRPIEVEMGTTVVLTVSAGGNLTVLGYVLGSDVAASSAGKHYWASRSQMFSPVNGVVEVRLSDGTTIGDVRVRNVVQVPPASVTPAVNGELVFQATSNTSLTIKYKGSDGTVRSAVLALA